MIFQIGENLVFFKEKFFSHQILIFFNNKVARFYPKF
jgi:hypothetical protein